MFPPSVGFQLHVQRDQDLSVNMQCEGLHTQSRVIMQARQPKPKSAIRRAQHLPHVGMLPMLPRDGYRAKDPGHRHRR